MVRLAKMLGRFYLSVAVASAAGCQWILGIEDVTARPDGSIDAAPSGPALIDRGLVVRYFLDEAASGSGEAFVRDSAPDPLDLVLVYDKGMAFTEAGGNRGLVWPEVLGNDRARARAPEGSKVRTRLHGSLAATIELVVDIEELAAGSRITHLGMGDDREFLTLVSPYPGRIQLRWRDNRVAGGWWLSLPAAGRVVMHVVFASYRRDEDERVRLYVDGAVHELRTGDGSPDRYEPIDIPDRIELALGNRFDGGRSIRGTIYYAAIYAMALDDAAIEHNARLLRAVDDLLREQRPVP